MLSHDQRMILLNIARDSIRCVLEGRPHDVDAVPADDALRRPAGTFVTLKTREGELRGCIGSVRAVEPLVRAVASSAVAAAFRDPRFLPLAPGELAEVRLEISVMGPLETVRDIGEIECGRDGLIVSRGRNAGLLLPQVAAEYGWDRETFLDHTCMKAGLEPGAWRDALTTIERFAAEVFGE
jgi:AmmeMemoRadiSam system protein A